MKTQVHQSPVCVCFEALKTKPIPLDFKCTCNRQKWQV